MLKSSNKYIHMRVERERKKEREGNYFSVFHYFLYLDIRVSKVPVCNVHR